MYHLLSEIRDFYNKTLESGGKPVSVTFSIHSRASPGTVYRGRLGLMPVSLALPTETKTRTKTTTTKKEKVRTAKLTAKRAPPSSHPTSPLHAR